VKQNYRNNKYEKKTKRLLGVMRACMRKN